MPALSYSRQNIEKYDFENKILHGIKIHTIRRHRKKPFKVGDTLYHYKNWRTRDVKKICENICLYIADIEIRPLRVATKNNRHIYQFGFFDVYINGRKIDLILNNKLAKNDGFDSYENFKDFFIKAGLPFYGQIIGWKEGINYVL